MTKEMEVREDQENSLLAGQLAKQIESSMIIAKRFPREIMQVQLNISSACKRFGLADKAVYSYPRAGESISGASIRLMEAIAQLYGNIDYGVIELERKGEYSEMMAYAWDLESNTRSTKIFKTKHWRDTKRGGYVVKDERDIYEVIANLSTRRMRACLMAVIPKDIIDEAVTQCAKTLEGAYKKPLIDRTRDILKFFKDKYSVSLEQVEKHIGYKSARFNEQDFKKLKGIAEALKDCIGTREDYFDFSEPEENNFTKSLKKKSLDDVEGEDELEQTKIKIGDDE